MTQSNIDASTFLPDVRVTRTCVLLFLTSFNGTRLAEDGATFVRLYDKYIRRNEDRLEHVSHLLSRLHAQLLARALQNTIDCEEDDAPDDLATFAKLGKRCDHDTWALLLANPWLGRMRTRVVLRCLRLRLADDLDVNEVVELAVSEILKNRFCVGASGQSEWT